MARSVFIAPFSAPSPSSRAAGSAGRLTVLCGWSRCSCGQLLESERNALQVLADIAQVARPVGRSHQSAPERHGIVEVIILDSPCHGPTILVLHPTPLTKLLGFPHPDRSIAQEASEDKWSSTEQKENVWPSIAPSHGRIHLGRRPNHESAAGRLGWRQFQRERAASWEGGPLGSRMTLGSWIPLVENIDYMCIPMVASEIAFRLNCTCRHLLQIGRTMPRRACPLPGSPLIGRSPIHG